MQIFFLVLLFAMFVMLWVITKQEKIIIELSHKIKVNDAVNAVIFSHKDYKLLLQLEQEVKMCQKLICSCCAGSYGRITGIADGKN